MVADPAEAGHGHEPDAGQRGEVHAISGVARQIVKIDEGGLTEVFMGEVEMPDFGRHDRLDAR